MQVSLEAEDIRNEKVKVLRCMKTMSMDDVVVGQYRARSFGGVHHKGYLDDPTVPAGRCAHMRPPPSLPRCRACRGSHLAGCPRLAPRVRCGGHAAGAHATRA